MIHPAPDRVVEITHYGEDYTHFGQCCKPKTLNAKNINRYK